LFAVDSIGELSARGLDFPNYFVVVDFPPKRTAMASHASTIEISGLERAKLAKLRQHAKSLGISAEHYAKQLIEEGLSLEQQARSKTFDELLAPVRAGFRRRGMSEEELDKLVDQARTRHHKRVTRKKA
jgi:hypothetical protein